MSEKCEMSVHETFMREALKLAEEAGAAEEVPVGAVVVRDGSVIGRGKNSTVAEKNPLRHAEINAINDALQASGGWRLTGCDLYVTLEPCSMCAGAIVHSRIRKLIIGAADPKSGACGSVLDITGEQRLNHNPEVITGVLGDECSGILKNFFKKLRRK